MIKKYNKFLKENNVGMGSLYYTQYPFAYNTMDNPSDRGKEGNIEYHRKLNSFQDIQDEIKNLIEKDLREKDNNITDLDVENEIKSFFNIADNKKAEIRNISDNCKDIKKCAKEIYNKYKRYSDINNAKDNVNDVLENLEWDFDDEEFGGGDFFDINEGESKYIYLNNLEYGKLEKLVHKLNNNNAIWGGSREYFSDIKKNVKKIIEHNNLKALWISNINGKYRVFFTYIDPNYHKNLKNLYYLDDIVKENLEWVFDDEEVEDNNLDIKKDEKTYIFLNSLKYEKIEKIVSILKDKNAKWGDGEDFSDIKKSVEKIINTYSPTFNSLLINFIGGKYRIFFTHTDRDLKNLYYLDDIVKENLEWDFDEEEEESGIDKIEDILKRYNKVVIYLKELKRYDIIKIAHKLKELYVKWGGSRVSFTNIEKQTDYIINKIENNNKGLDSLIMKNINGNTYVYFTSNVLYTDNFIIKNINENKESNILTESVKKDGKYGFFIFLDIIDELKNSFIKEDYLNTSDYNIFFTTDKIENKNKLSDILEFKKSLSVAYRTITHIRNLRLSFYFGIKDFKLEYGFHDDLKRVVYKVGEFKVTSDFLKRLNNYKCLTLISNILDKVLLKDLVTLQKSKMDLKYFIDEKFNDIKITDENRVIKTINNIELDNYVEENKLTEYFDAWCFKHSWYYSTYNYVDRDDTNTYFYIKIKDSDDGLNYLKRRTDIDKIEESHEDDSLHVDPESADEPQIYEPLIKEPLESEKLKKNDNNKKSKKKNKTEKKKDKKKFLVKYYKDLKRALVKIQKDNSKNKSYSTKHLYKIVDSYDKPFIDVKMDLEWLYKKLLNDPEFIEKEESKIK